MPTPNLPPPDRPDSYPVALTTAYFAALGEFIHEFGKTENELAFLLIRYATGHITDSYNVDPHKVMSRTTGSWDVCRGLIGSQRAAGLADLIKVMARIGNADEDSQANLEAALAHFAEIRFVRDRITHNGAAPQHFQGEWRLATSNRQQVREAEKGNTIRFRIEDIEAATADLQSIRLRVSAELVTEHTGARRLAEEFNAYAPWRYKPSELIREGHKA